jgi:hypothetical protein
MAIILNGVFATPTLLRQVVTCGEYPSRDNLAPDQECFR